MLLKEASLITTETIEGFKKLLPELMNQKEQAEKIADELQERIIFLQSQIEKANSKFEVWKDELKQVFEQEIEKVEAKNANICRLYSLELQFHKAIINQKE